MKYFSTLFLLLISCAISHAQPDVWERIDVGLRSGFGQDDLQSYRNFMSYDSLHWIVEWSGGIQFETYDGGKSWSKIPVKKPLPHTITSDGFGYGEFENGKPTYPISTDSGKTWQTATPVWDKFLGDVQFWQMSFYSRTIGTSSLRINLTHRNPATNSDTTIVVTRLAITTDGTKWQALDSVETKTVNGKLMVTLALPQFGALPSPTGFTDPAVLWYNALHGAPKMLDNEWIRVFTVAVDSGGYGSRKQHYVGYLNTTTFAAKWYPLPEETSNDNLSFQAPIPSILYILGYSETDGSLNIWKSVDSGAVWKRVEISPKIDRVWGGYYGADAIVISNYIGIFKTTDDGKTWEVNYPPYRFWWDGNGFIVHMVDAQRIAWVSDKGVCFISEDAGKTWQKNGAGGRPFSIATAGKKILISRNFQTLLYSDDEAMSWRELGAEGKLPERLSAMFALAFVDTTKPDGKVVGIGAFIDDEGKDRLSILHSNDGGVNWSEGWRLPDSLAKLVTNNGYPDPPLLPNIKFYRSADGATNRGFLTIDSRLLTSDDGGMTWQQQPVFVVNGVGMLNADVGVTMDTLPGRTARILRTSDGGKSWQPIYTTRPSMYPVMVQLFGLDTVRCYLGFDGKSSGQRSGSVALLSNDGGKTWDSATARLLTSGERRTFTHWQNPQVLYHFTGDNTFRFTFLPGSDTAVENIIGIPDFIYAHAVNSQWFYVAGDKNLVGRFRIGTLPTSDISETPISTETFRLLPNVAGERVQFEFGDWNNVDVRVCNQLGAEVMRFRPSGQQVELDLRGVPIGRYMVQVRSEQGVKSLPLTVVR